MKTCYNLKSFWILTISFVWFSVLNCFNNPIPKYDPRFKPFQNPQMVWLNLLLLIYSRGLCYYPFAVNLDEYIGSCNSLNDLSNRVCTPNKIEDLNLSVFNIITRTSESKMLTKHISSKCEFMIEGRKYNLNKKWNNGKCRCEWKL